jgi:hypothetical protein
LSYAVDDKQFELITKQELERISKEQDHGRRSPWQKARSYRQLSRCRYSAFDLDGKYLELITTENAVEIIAKV